MSKAVFLDRDGTLVHPVHFPSHPDQIQVHDGVADHLRVLQEAGWRLVVVTNQSGIARGYFDEPALDRMHERLRQQLGAQHVRLDAIYACPHHPEGSVAGYAIDCGCRKPAAGMLRQAADELNLDPHACWMIGDILDDVEAGHRAGCRTVLIDLGTEPVPETLERRPEYVARNTAHALEVVRAMEALGPPVDLTWQPAHWRGHREAIALGRDGTDASHS